LSGSKNFSLKIGEVSQQTGCKIETIRYYERIGLLPEPTRSEGRFRLYRREHVKRLNFIRRSRKLGFSLEEIRGLLRLVDSSHYTCAEVKEITVGHLREIESKIEDLQTLRAVLGEMASQCDGGEVPKCPVIDALYK